MDKLPQVSGSGARMDQVYVTPRLQAMLTRAEGEAKRLKDDYVSIEHVLLAATDEKAFKEGVSRIPDPDKKFDPWGNLRQGGK